jgi:ABC-2 type transport system permease protein
MPVEGRGYRRREPRGELRRFRALPIAQETLRQVLRRRLLLLFLAVSLVPFAIGAIVVFILTRGGAMLQDPRAISTDTLPHIARFFLGYLKYPQTLFAILLSIWAGAGSIADDLRTGALLMYLSRPLTRLDYVLGKLGVLAALNFVLVVVPPLLLWGLAVALAPGDIGKSGLLTIPLSTIAAAVVLALVLAALVGGASAVSRNAAMAGALVVGLLVFFTVVAVSAPAGVRPALRLLSVLSDWSALCDGFFGTRDPGAPHWTAGLGALLLIAAGAGTLLWRRVRAIEIVG